jgi:hypothetical protein
VGVGQVSGAEDVGTRSTTSTGTRIRKSSNPSGAKPRLSRGAGGSIEAKRGRPRNAWPTTWELEVWHAAVVLEMRSCGICPIAPWREGTSRRKGIESRKKMAWRLKEAFPTSSLL